MIKVTYDRSKESTILEISAEQLGNILFCLGQVADSDDNTPKNRQQAADLYKEIQEANGVAEVI